MSVRVKTATIAATALGLGVTAAQADPVVTTYGPYYGPYGGRAGAVVATNPNNGNVHAAWGARGPYGYATGGDASVYHGPCGTEWRAVRHGPRGVRIRRGAVGNGAC